MAIVNDGTRDTPVTTAFVVGIVLAATVGLALGFQHIGGYIPCKLCLQQRWPYYIGAPLALLTAYMGGAGVSPKVLKFLLILLAIVLAVGVFLGVKHAGVEYGWWAGPTDCGAVAPGIDTGGKGVLDALNSVVPPSCDKPAWQDPILRLSFAGWNAIISFVLLLVTLRGIAKT